MAVARGRGLLGLLGRRAPEVEEPAVVPPVRQTPWDNVGLAVDRAMRVFLAATAEVPGVERIAAKSSGPSVHFLVTVSDRPWDLVIDDIEAQLFPLAKDGTLPPFDYEVQRSDEPGEPGYIEVFPG